MQRAWTTDPGRAQVLMPTAETSANYYQHIYPKLAITISLVMSQAHAKIEVTAQKHAGKTMRIWKDDIKSTC